MAEGHGRQRWAHTSAILAVIANVNRPRKARLYKPSDFDPYSAPGSAPGSGPGPGSRGRRDAAAGLTDLSMLKQAFVGSKQPPLEATP